MKRISVIVIFLSLLPFWTYGQSVYLPKAGDSLHLTLLSGFPAACRDSIVDFSAVCTGKMVERKFIRKSDSTMYVTEQGRSQLLYTHGDTILIMSDGRPGYRITANRPSHYQFLHPRSAGQVNFDGRGIEGSNTNIRNFGIASTDNPYRQDVITPDGDSIAQAIVMRTSLISNIRRSADPADSLLMAAIDYATHDFLADSICLIANLTYYYIEECRYPILQTEEYVMLADGIKADSLAVGYYYPVDRQYQEIDLLEHPQEERGMSKSRQTAYQDDSLVDGFDMEVSCSIYPVVFGSEIKINLSGDDPDDYTVQFFNMEGKLMLSAVASFAVVDTSGLPRGSYIIQVSEGAHNFTFKAVKL